MKQNFESNRKNFGKSYIVISPDNEKFIVKNLNLWCVGKDINPIYLRAVARKEQKTHKGWKCEFYIQEQIDNYIKELGK